MHTQRTMHMYISPQAKHVVTYRHCICAPHDLSPEHCRDMCLHDINKAQHVHMIDHLSAETQESEQEYNNCTVKDDYIKKYFEILHMYTKNIYRISQQRKQTYSIRAFIHTSTSTCTAG